jgi:hypothetical protein
MTWRVLALIALFSAPAATRASDSLPEEELPPTVIAIVIGSNTSVDSELPPLKYADDDAARMYDLFRLLGARTYLLANLDENTARLHPDAKAVAHVPRNVELSLVVQLAASDVRSSRSRGERTVLYLTYAGHGNQRDGRGYLTLEDERLLAGDLMGRIVDPVGADRAHLIIDACYSYLLAFGRGPGGERRKAEGFSRLETLAGESGIGLLLSTSSAKESHEWEQIQSGVFSHEVRSGLYGAADADLDGRITYQEMAAFVDRANAAVPNEKYRPQVFATPPRRSGTLVDLRPALGRALVVDPDREGHYLLETAEGVRLIDFHNGKGQGMQLVRGASATYLRHLPDDVEYAIPQVDGVVRLAALSPAAPRVRERGAAHDSFQKLFELPFDARVVERYSFRGASASDNQGGWHLRDTVGLGALVGSGALAVVGAGSLIGALVAYGTVSPTTPNEQVIERNRLILALDGVALSALAIGAVAAATGSALLLWPKGDE